MAELIQLVDGVSVHKIPLAEGCMRIGRQESNDIHIADSAVSGSHAQVTIVKNPHLNEVLDIFVEDLASTNGTFINDLRVTQKTAIYHGDILRIGWNEFQLCDETQPGFEATVHILQPE